MDKEGQTPVIEIEEVRKRKKKKKSMVRGLATGHCYLVARVATMLYTNHLSI